MLRPIASRLITSSKLGSILTRNSSVVVGPPTKHISVVEKYTLAGIMMVALCAVPVYIMSNLKVYKAPKA